MIDYLWLIWLVTCVPVYALNVWLWRVVHMKFDIYKRKPSVPSEYFFGIIWIIGTALALFCMIVYYLIDLETPQWLKKLHGRGEE